MFGSAFAGGQSLASMSVFCKCVFCLYLFASLENLFCSLTVVICFLSFWDTLGDLCGCFLVFICFPGKLFAD